MIDRLASACTQRPSLFRRQAPSSPNIHPPPCSSPFASPRPPQRFPPEFKPWTDIVPNFTYKRELPYFQMMVPTVDTVRFSYLLEACLDVQRSVLFTGEQR
jgi:hypothetical protein